MLKHKLLLGLLSLVMNAFSYGDINSHEMRSHIIAELTNELVEGFSNTDGGYAWSVFDANTTHKEMVGGIIDGKGSLKVNKNSIFAIQSQSKMFTSVAILYANEVGLLNIDKPISDYLNNYHFKSPFEKKPEDKMTIRMMLSHRAGFTHEAKVGNNFNSSEVSFHEHVKSINDEWLRFPVNQKAKYSNLGFDLAGLILEHVSKMSFHDFLKEKILAPLQMEDSYTENSKIHKHVNRAVGYVKGIDNLPATNSLLASGGVYSSLNDMKKFASFLLKGLKGDELAPISSKTVQEMFLIQSPLPGQIKGYGIGTFINHINGLKVVGHDGGGFGFSSSTILIPELNLGIVVLHNRYDFSYKSRIMDVLNKLTNRSDAHTSRMCDGLVVDSSSSSSSQYVGAYVGDFSELSMSQKQGALYLTSKSKNLFCIVDKDDLNKVHGRVGRSTATVYNLVVPGIKQPPYIVSQLDGSTWEYNGVMDSTHPTTDQRNKYIGKYVYRSMGRIVGNIDVTTKDSHFYLNGQILKWLSEGVFMTPTGEVLDLHNQYWRNIKIERQS